MFTQRPVVLKVCFPFVPFNFSSFSLRHQLPALGHSSPKPPHFISTLHLRRWRNMMCNICKRISGLHEEWRQLQVRKCHNICIKMKLIIGLTSALLLSLLTAGQVPGHIWPSWLIFFPHWAYLLLLLCPDSPMRHSQRYGSRQHAPHATSKHAHCFQAHYKFLISLTRLL